MSGSNKLRDKCSKCDHDRSVCICRGCKKLFCMKHIEAHKKDLQKELDCIEEEHKTARKTFDQWNKSKQLSDDIDQWETDFIEKVKSAAVAARKDLKLIKEQSDENVSGFLKQFTQAIDTARKDENINEIKINSIKQQLADFQKELSKRDTTKLVDHDIETVPLLKLETSYRQIPEEPNTTNQDANDGVESRSEKDPSEKLSRPSSVTLPPPNVQQKLNPSPIPHSSAYLSMIFGLNVSTTTNKHIQRLFDELMLLPMMDKNGPMSGKCEFETNQMEQFLTNTFGFQNIPGKYIVQGVRAFQLARPPKSLPHDHKIHFPCKSESSFTMTVREIQEWQSTYRVYAGKGGSMTHDFLKQALQGKSGDGEEAFRMKFVVRISTCPILMEFDGKVIPRKPSEDWPNRIKLVSVTGIDFAGRKHDVDDILHYIKNWADIFEVDHTQTKPALLNERDFARRRGAVVAELSESRLFNDLQYMTYLRLRACDEEGVQIVVETGIGLGVFSGRHIGIDERVRTTSAIAIRTVLERYGPSYRNIRAVVFALPIFERGTSDEHIRDTYHTFTEQFAEPQYNGPIPVLIADQDMHRLTVAIARQGFTVSELNPADSHGVFGEYWQNRGPAVEEKLALTTAGLLVQHHVINPEVLHAKNYKII
ncbi:hypothetical protein I4U23_020436 [Adineta vaga]|nr:hypothetical protein I4U23_020436 [Adineta vaga]